MYPRFNELMRDVVGLSKGGPEVHLIMFKRHSRTYVCFILVIQTEVNTWVENAYWTKCQAIETSWNLHNIVELYGARVLK